ncbi:inositol polyphosphate kinase 1 [Anaeramoeba ignava]|uniref:Inositol-pentakisphosphate 2-kinase n=1 Tax=Anaeramoeba ignava TaxID=1746090 RepID=A0A9Q0L8A3_ANAIG|nr:inositol polyphosphate kinase 1 [Anaeramoeba ignava]
MNYLSSIPLKIEDWQYMNEGNGNIVLEYCGLFHEDLNGTVLRLKKQKITNKIIKTEKENESLIEKELTNYKFYSNVLSPLFNNKFIYPGLLLAMNENFLTQIEKKISKQRPKFRRETTQINLKTNYNIVQPNHSIFPKISEENYKSCLSIELKPKCGFIPNSPFIDKNNQFKKQFSRYFLHQRLKKKKGEIEEISLYDPIDLFSNDKNQIFHAMDCLLNNPQNNLKIFLDSQLIFGGIRSQEQEGDEKTELRKLLMDQNHLQTQLKNIFNKEKQNIQSLKEIITQIILKTKVLDNILNLQKLDNLDIEGIYQIYQNLNNSKIEIPSWKKICDNQPFLESILQNIKKPKIENEENLLKFKLEDLSKEESIMKIIEFLISSSVKDCSVMITIQEVEKKDKIEENSIIKDENSGKFFQFKIAIIDLDPRSAEKIITAVEETKEQGKKQKLDRQARKERFEKRKQMHQEKNPKILEQNPPDPRNPTNPRRPHPNPQNPDLSRIPEDKLREIQAELQERMKHEKFNPQRRRKEKNDL